MSSRSRTSAHSRKAVRLCMMTPAIQFSASASWGLVRVKPSWSAWSRGMWRTLSTGGLLLEQGGGFGGRASVVCDVVASGAVGWVPGVEPQEPLGADPVGAQAPDEPVGFGEFGLLLRCERGEVGDSVECGPVADELFDDWCPARGAALGVAAPRPGGHQAGVPFMTGTVISLLIAVTTSANAARSVSVGRSSL